MSEIYVFVSSPTIIITHTPLYTHTHAFTHTHVQYISILPMSMQDCVDMDCDGPKHALVRDIDGHFVGTSPAEGSVVPFAELR